jgi:hypothetical protein
MGLHGEFVALMCIFGALLVKGLSLFVVLRLIWPIDLIYDVWSLISIVCLSCLDWLGSFVLMDVLAKVKSGLYL